MIHSTSSHHLEGALVTESVSSNGGCDAYFAFSATLADVLISTRLFSFALLLLGSATGHCQSQLALPGSIKHYALHVRG